jgi:hypothetical protein
MLRLNALGCRRCVASVKEEARRPTDASATSTRGMRAIFSGAQLGRNDSDRRASLPLMQPSRWEECRGRWSSRRTI